MKKETVSPLAAQWPSCGDFDIRIARDGTWFYRNSPIGRKALVRLFSTVLRRDETGEYWLITPAERGRVEVEDAPFIAVEMRHEGEKESRVIQFRTNVEDWVTAGPNHPIIIRHGVPYVAVRQGLEAKINRPLYYDLAELSETERLPNGQACLAIWSNGQKFILGAINDPA